MRMSSAAAMRQRVSTLAFLLPFSIIARWLRATPASPESTSCDIPRCTRMHLVIVFHIQSPFLIGVCHHKRLCNFREHKVATFGPQWPRVGPFAFLGHFPRIRLKPERRATCRLCGQRKAASDLSAFADKNGWQRGYHVCRTCPKNGGCIMKKITLALIKAGCSSVRRRGMQ